MRSPNSVRSTWRRWRNWQPARSASGSWMRKPPTSPRRCRLWTNRSRNAGAAAVDLRFHQRTFQPVVSRAVRRRRGTHDHDRRGDSRRQGAGHGAAARQEEHHHPSPVGRGEGTYGDRAGILDVPAQSGAVLPARRGRCAPGRLQHRALLRPGAQDVATDPVPVYQPQQAHHGDGGTVDRRHHAGAGRIPRGSSGYRGGAQASRGGSGVSDLQYGLLAIGAVVVIAVLAYNKWQEIKYRHEAEGSLKSRHGDVLMGAAEDPATAQPAPAARPQAKRGGERIEPTFDRPDTGAVPAAPKAPGAAPGLTETIDFIVAVE